MRKLAFVLLVMAALVGCNGDTGSYDAARILDSRLLEIDDVEGDFEFIALDDSCVDAIIPDVWNVKISDGHIFVLSAQEGVFQFGRKGEFVRKISQKGNGPGEWSVIIDIAVDESGDKLYIYDYSGKVMCFSTASGEYVGKSDIAGKMFSKIFVKGNNLLVAPYNSMGNEEAMLYNVNLESSAVQAAGSLAKFALADYNNMMYSFTKGVIDNGNNVLVHPNLSGTVYSYSPESNLISEEFSISFSNPLVPELMGQGFEGLKQGQTIMDIARNRQYFFVKICNKSTNGEWYAIDNANNETFKLSLKYVPDAELGFVPKYQAGSCVADLIYANAFEENTPELAFICRKIGRKITPESNPVIVIWRE